jgi:hypothetical protein
MSPVQGRSITGLESESAARTCLIAGPSVKHPRGTREETFVFRIPALTVGNGIGGYGEDEDEDEDEDEEGSEG